MAEKLNSGICLAVIILLLVITGLAQAAIITVGRGRDAGYDFSSIQSGIDVANDGDEVLVASGEYVITEPVTFRGKAITVKSEAGHEETTIRMGTPADSERASVVIFENNETAASVIEGFTITNGKGCWVAPLNGSVGGGIYSLASSATVRNCAIVQNSAIGGGGIVCEATSSPTLIDCIIAENSAGASNVGGLSAVLGASVTLTNCIISKNSSTEYTGGVGCWEGSALILTNCIISENSARLTAGGVMGSANSSVTMTDCVVTGNKAETGVGGGIHLSESRAELTNCVITRNTAGSGGGGVGCAYASSLSIRNCTIWGNSTTGSYYPGFAGGGVGCFSDSSAEITNSIIWGNTSPRGDQIALTQGASTMTVAYSNVAGGQAKAHVDSGCTLNWGEGNIDANPLFAEPGYWADINDPNIMVEQDDPNTIWIDGDYHLKSEASRWDPVSESWVVDDVTSPCIDTGDPISQIGDEPELNGGIINMGAYGGTAEASLSLPIVYVQWLGHSSVKVWTDDCIVYVDPQSLSISPHDATFVCVTHTHGDHYSRSDIARVSNDQTQFIGPPDVVSQYGSGLSIAPWQTMEFDFVDIEAVPSYNTNKPNHPKSRNWLGYIIELGGKRIYVAGDTDLIDEMKMLGDINVAFLPAGGTYTMNATEAAEATEYIKPDLAIPYHWGRNVGTLADAQRFAELARCPAMVLAVGETISSDNWPVYSPLIAHWALDEVEGSIAYDSAGENHGTLSGGPAWQPAGGKIAGALQFDEIDDYVSTDFVLDPANGAFSVFAWIKGDVPGQVVISQTDGTGSGETWLGTDDLLGKLMTGLVPPPAGRFVPQPLVSESVITDGQWHHIGFAWDGSYRILYVDGTEVAKDITAQNPLKSTDGGLYIGTGNNLETGTFFSGLIDDVRIYNLVLTADEIETLTH